MSASRLKSFNYAVGMFGTSIPINMLKAYATYFYVDKMGLTIMTNVATILLSILLSMPRQPCLRLFSDRTCTRWGAGAPGWSSARP